MVIGYMIPAGPAATGTFNYAIVLGLSAFAVDDAVTGALALLLYAITIAVNVAVGLVGVAAGGISMRAVVHAPSAAGQA